MDGILNIISKNSAKLKRDYYFHAGFLEEVRYIENESQTERGSRGIECIQIVINPRAERVALYDRSMVMHAWEEHIITGKNLVYVGWTDLDHFYDTRSCCDDYCFWPQFHLLMRTGVYNYCSPAKEVLWV